MKKTHENKPAILFRRCFTNHEKINLVYTICLSKSLDKARWLF